VALLDAADVRLAGAVVETRPPKKKKTNDKKWRVLLKNLSEMTPSEKLEHLFRVIARRFGRSFGKPKGPSTGIYDDSMRATKLLADKGIPYLGVAHHSSEATSEFLIRNGITTAFLLSGGIIKSSILELEDFEMFCAHPAILPKHRSPGGLC